MNNEIEEIEQAYFKKDLPELGPGDTVKIYLKIKEEDKERIQKFEGIVISKRGSGLSKTFTVRKISHGEGVERTFPLHSPSIQKIEVVRKGKVRRAKLYYLRGKVGKKTKVKEQRQYTDDRRLKDADEHR